MEPDPLAAIFSGDADAPRLRSPELSAIGESLSETAPEFIDAVTRMCELSWENGERRPAGWLELHSLSWWVDLDSGANRQKFLTVVTATVLVDALDTTAGIAWVSEVLPGVIHLDRTTFTDRGRKVVVHLREEPTLAPQLRNKIHPLDFTDFVRELDADADLPHPLTTSAGGSVSVIR